jgi:hypothetical protein
MVRLRWKTQIDVIDTSLELGLLFEGVHFDRKIGASELAHPAPNAIIGTGCEHFAALQLQHLLRAECHAKVAAFAVILPNDMKESFFWFCHFFALVCVSPHSI